MTFRLRTGVAAVGPAFLLAASVAVPFSDGCGDDSTTFQPDAASDDAAGEIGADGATTPPVVDAGAVVDAVAADVAPVDAPADAPTCALGSAGSFATQQDLNLFGQITYFDNGAVLSAGHYRVQYIDGCMKYGPGQDWTVHAYSDGSDAFWLGTVTGDKLFMPPGTAGYTAADDGGAFVSFDDCVAANRALPPKEFDFAGGQLGVWLADSPYSDNMAGVSDDGGIDNPQWSLTLLSGACTNTE
jgi:hypothetical protein